MTGHIGRQAAVTEHLGYRRRISEILLHQARIAKGTLVYIARSPLAFGVRAGGMKRDVSTVEALKQTLLGAESIAQPDASGGAQDGPPTNHTIVAVAPARQRSSEPFRA